MFFIEGNGERTTSLHTELKKRSAVRTLQKKQCVFNALSADLGCGHIQCVRTPLRGIFSFLGRFRK